MEFKPIDMIVIGVLALAIILKAHEMIFGRKRTYDCCNCANCYGGNQEGGPCDECVDGNLYEERRGG